MTTWSQNPPTIKEMREILFLIRMFEKSAAHDQPVRTAIELAKYILQDAIKRPLNPEKIEGITK